MKDRYTRVTAPAGFDGQATRRDYYFKTRNAAREFRLRFLKWSVSGARTRTIFPFSDLTVADWVKNRIQEGTPDDSRAAMLVDPANARLEAAGVCGRALFAFFHGSQAFRKAATKSITLLLAALGGGASRFCPFALLLHRAGVSVRVFCRIKNGL